jgi:hypothetical protein
LFRTWQHWRAWKCGLPYCSWMLGGVNECLHHAIHLTKISKNLVEVLAIHPLVFLFQVSWAQFCEVEALLKIIDWLKVGLLQVWDEGDDGYILKVQDCPDSGNSIPIYEACTLSLILMIYIAKWMHLHSSGQFLNAGWRCTHLDLVELGIMITTWGGHSLEGLCNHVRTNIGCHIFLQCKNYM